MPTAVRAFVPIACGSCSGPDVTALWLRQDGHFHCLMCSAVKAVSDIEPNLTACEVLAVNESGQLGCTFDHVEACFCPDIP